MFSALPAVCGGISEILGSLALLLSVEIRVLNYSPIQVSSNVDSFGGRPVDGAVVLVMNVLL